MLQEKNMTTIIFIFMIARIIMIIIMKLKIVIAKIYHKIRYWCCKNSVTIIIMVDFEFWNSNKPSDSLHYNIEWQNILSSINLKRSCHLNYIYTYFFTVFNSNYLCMVVFEISYKIRERNKKNRKNTSKLQ